MLSATEKLLMIKFLGYSPTPETRQLFNAKLAYMVGADEDLEQQIKQTIRELTKIQEDLDNSRLGAGRSFQSGASTVQYFRGDRLLELREHGKQYVIYLSRLCGLPVLSNVFGGGDRGTSHGQVVRG